MRRIIIHNLRVGPKHRELWIYLKESNFISFSDNEWSTSLYVPKDKKFREEISLIIYMFRFPIRTVRQCE